MTSLAHAALDQLSALLGKRCLTDPDSAQRYGVDWTKVWAPAPSAVVLPETTEEVQQIVEIANEHGLHLVPSGGRTGLSAGAVAANGELVVAFDRMNRVLDFNEYDRSVTVQPGVVTQQLQEFADSKELFYPVDFASAGSSQIGGNIGCAIITEKSWLVHDGRTVAARSVQRQLQRVRDILGLHRRAKLPGDDVSAVIVKACAQLEAAPAAALEKGKLGPAAAVRAGGGLSPIRSPTQWKLSAVM